MCSIAYGSKPEHIVEPGYSYTHVGLAPSPVSRAREHRKWRELIPPLLAPPTLSSVRDRGRESVWNGESALLSSSNALSRPVSDRYGKWRECPSRDLPERREMEAVLEVVEQPGARRCAHDLKKFNHTRDKELLGIFYHYLNGSQPFFLLFLTEIGAQL